MKNSFLSGLLLLSIFMAYSQEIIYTISASHDGQTMHLDSIMFENLSNDTRFVVGNLPVLPAYDIDLSSQLLVTQVEQVRLPFGEDFRIVRNIPGEVGIQYMGNALENATLSVFNMAGQRVYARDMPVLNQHEIITVNIPGTGIYLLNIGTNLGSVNYRALGSTQSFHGKFNLSISQQSLQTPDVPNTAPSLKSSGLDGDFSYQVGDTILITVFLEDYFAKPSFSPIAESAQFHFEMHAGEVENKGYFTDSRDYQSYIWVKIGEQVWMAENLRFLPEVVGPGTGSETTAHYYVHGYNGTDAGAARATANYHNYGVLYNWTAAMAGAASSSTNPSGVQGVCPPGWHVPGDAEWTQLLDYVVAQGYPNSNEVNGASNALKSCRQDNSPLGGECNTSLHPRWNSHITYYGTDAFGFSALPGGHCDAFRGGFGLIGGQASWWSATEGTELSAWSWRIYAVSGTVGSGDGSKVSGFSIRCMKDADTGADAYNLTLKVSPPEAGSVQGAGEYQAGEQVSISATANPDWEFVSWTDSTGSVVATTADHDFVMPAGNFTLTANFKKKTAYETGTFTDPRDEQVYGWVKIGDQVWMAENLRYLPEVVGPGTGSETNAHYYVQGYNGTDVDAARATANYQNYGVLYNWTAAMAGASSSSSNPSGIQGICAPGWHLPSHDEWTELERHVCEALGNDDCDTKFPFDNTSWNWRGTIEGNALKSCRQVNSSHYESCNTSDHPRWDAHDTHFGIDGFGFSALPGGNRRSTGSFSSFGGNGHWWSATGTHTERAWERTMRFDYSGVYRNSSNKSIGYSVRCIRDSN